MQLVLKNIISLFIILTALCLKLPEALAEQSDATALPAKTWQGFDLSLYDSPKLEWTTTQRSEDGDGCSTIPQWRKDEIASGKFDKTNAYVEWLSEDAKRVGPFYLEKLADWWGVSQEVHSKIQPPLAIHFGVNDWFGENGFTNETHVSVQVGAGIRYLYECSKNLRDTDFYEILGHETGHLVVNATFQTTPYDDDYHMVIGRLAEFLARVSQNMISDAMKMKIDHPKKEKFDADDEHISFPAADCWYGTKGKNMSKTERRNFLLEMIKDYGTQNRDAVNQMLLDAQAACPNGSN